MNRRLRASACGIALLVAAHAAGFAWFEFGGAVVVWPGNTTIRYLSPTTFPPGDPLLDQFAAAMGEWSIVPGADFAYTYEVNDQDYVIDHFDGYSDTIAVDPSELDPGVIAATFTVNSGSSWYDMDILFSTDPGGYGYNIEAAPSCDVVANPASYGYNFLITALHELGHAVGLAHDPLGSEPPGSSWIVATMNPGYPLGGTNGADIVEIHADDRAGMQFLYPADEPVSPVTDLAVSNFASSTAPGIALPVSFLPTSAEPGATIMLQCLIENIGTTDEVGVEQGFYLSVDETIDLADVRIGGVEWELPAGVVYDFILEVELPGDLAAGSWTFGTILDDGEAIDEAWEDNNTVRYCAPLEIPQLAPVINPLPGEVVSDTAPFLGPLPSVTHPLNMAPIVWSLDNPEPGMVIDASTGQIVWAAPVAADFPYGLFVRATNDTGTATVLFLLGVEGTVPSCPPDIDGDGEVGFGDVLAVLAEWGPCVPCPPTCAADITGGPEGPDCAVDFIDLLSVLSNWGACP